MNIPLSKPFLGKEEENAAKEVIASGWVTQGPKVEEFENSVKNFVGAKHAVAVSNCTVALFLSMIVKGIGKGDEVICPALSYIASSNSILHAGATPVFVDVEKDTFNISSKSILKAITPKTKAILIVHQLGMPADMDEINSIAINNNLAIIEDAACALGSKFNNSFIGHDSEIACFSLHPRKIITTGEGGLILTNNDEIYAKLKLLRHHGMSISDNDRHKSNKVIQEDYVSVGYNFRMTDIQASIGIEQVKKLAQIISTRRIIVQLYKRFLADNDNIILPFEPKSCESNYQSFMVLIDENKRGLVLQEMKNKTISCKNGVMNILSTQAYKSYPNLGDSSNTIALEKRGVLLPLYTQMTEEEVKYVCNNINKITS